MSLEFMVFEVPQKKPLRWVKSTFLMAGFWDKFSPFSDISLNRSFLDFKIGLEIQLLGGLACIFVASKFLVIIGESTLCIETSVPVFGIFWLTSKAKFVSERCLRLIKSWTMIDDACGGFNKTLTKSICYSNKMCVCDLWRFYVLIYIDR